MIIVKKNTVSEIENDPDFCILVQEYAEECSIDGLPPPVAKMDMYRQLETTGLFHTFGAYLDDQLVGFITLLISLLPHYSTSVAISESYFVGYKYRKTGAGKFLLQRAEKCAREYEAAGILVSAPAFGTLSKFLPAVGYRETNQVFFRRLSHE